MPPQTNAIKSRSEIAELFSAGIIIAVFISRSSAIRASAPPRSMSRRPGILAIIGLWHLDAICPNNTESIDVASYDNEGAAGPSVQLRRAGLPLPGLRHMARNANDRSVREIHRQRLVVTGIEHERETITRIGGMPS